MRCVVPNCRNVSGGNGALTKRVTFHRFPKVQSLYMTWLKALKIKGAEIAVTSFVCSEHFLAEDLYITKNGVSRLRAGAKPFIENMKVCRMCLATDCTMYQLPEQEALDQAYKTLTGFKSDSVRLPESVCAACAQQLPAAARLRVRSLRAHAALMRLLEVHGQITPESIKTIKHEHEETRGIGEESFADIYDVDCKAEEKQEKVIDGDTKHNNIMGSCPTDMCDKTIDDNRESDENFTIQQELDIDDESMDVPLAFLKTEDDDDICQDDFSSADTLAAINDVPLFDAPDDGTVNVKVESYDEVLTLLGKENINNKCNNEDSRKSHMSADGENSSYAYDLKSREWVRPTKSLPKSDGRLDAIQQKASQPKTGKTRGNSIRGVRKSKADGKIEHPVAERSKIKGEKKSYSCGICYTMFCSDNNLRVHLRICHSDERPYSCNICNKAFKRKGNLKTHLITHSKNKPYKCEVCKKAFSYKSAMDYHLKTHSSERPYYVCDTCNKAFTSKAVLKTHLRLHSTEKSFICHICKKGFRQKTGLIIHAITHSDKRPYSCDNCSGTFKSQYNLKIHKKIHSENKEYLCHVCTKRCRSRQNLNLHLRVHSSEKPFSCDICNKAFKKKDKLKMHLRVHTGEKLYSCNICNKKFSQSGDLKRHLRIHSGDKPYSCNVCKSVFTLNDHLQKHLKTRHNIK